MRKHPEIGARIPAPASWRQRRTGCLPATSGRTAAATRGGSSCTRSPIEARILSVADAYEAMISDRVYRPAIGDAAAREELRVNSGTQFDAEAVEALLIALDREEQAVEAP